MYPAGLEFENIRAYLYAIRSTDDVIVTFIIAVTQIHIKYDRNCKFFGVLVAF